MASVTPWRRSIQPSPDGEGQAAIYRERAAHLRAIADAEADPIPRQQLRDIARQYDEIANSAVPLRRMLGAMRREIARRQTAEPQVADEIGRAAKNEKPTGR
jgi:hypothetical protein